LRHFKEVEGEFEENKREFFSLKVLLIFIFLNKGLIGSVCKVG